MSKYLHERNDFRDLILALSSELKIQPQLVEKDYWIMMSLYGLRGNGFDFDLKGGTSLSKGWRCIDRFSEDIDIKIHPPTELNLRTGKNHDKPKDISSRRDYFDSLAKKIKISGFESVVRDTAFDDESMRNGGIRLLYESEFEQLEGVKEGILLEVGFDVTSPNQMIDLTSWMFERASEAKLDVKDNRAKQVKCYLPEYIFVEKLQTISTKYRQVQAGKEMPANFMRHYYDAYNLLKLERVKKFIGTTEYVSHKDERFRAGDEKVILKNHAFTLSNDEIKSKLQLAYSKSKNLYFKGQPPLDEIVSEFQKWLQKL